MKWKFARIVGLLALFAMFGLTLNTFQEAKADTNTVGFDVDYLSNHWGTVASLAGAGGGTNCCVTQSDTIYVHQYGPSRLCHYRVFYRIPGSGNDYHGPTTTLGPTYGDVGISFEPEPSASRFDIQLNCDNFVGAVYGYTYAY